MRRPAAFAGVAICIMLALFSSGCDQPSQPPPPGNGDDDGFWAGSIDPDADSWYQVTAWNDGTVTVDATTGNAQGGIGESVLTEFGLRCYNLEVGDQISFEFELDEPEDAADWAYSLYGGNIQPSIIISQDMFDIQQETLGFSDPLILTKSVRFTISNTASAPAKNSKLDISWEVVNKPSMLGFYTFNLYAVGDASLPTPSTGNIWMGVFDTEGDPIPGAYLELHYTIATGPGYYTAYTNEDGYNKFQGVPVDIYYTITAEATTTGSGEAEYAVFTASFLAPLGDSVWAAQFTGANSGQLSQVINPFGGD